MTKRWKITAVLAVVMMIALASNVTAQTVLEATSGQSNTNAATAGLFYEDRDFYLSTTDIGSLTKNLIFVNLFAPKILGGKTSATTAATTGASTTTPAIETIEDTDMDGVFGSAGDTVTQIPATTTTTTTTTTTPAKINGFAYDPYFDAGAGFFAGSNWIGIAFSYGVVEDKSEVENAAKTVTIATDGTETSSTTTENATAISEWRVRDTFTLAAIFGNKTWGVKNNLRVVNYRDEGYLTQNAVTTGLGTSSLNLSLGAITPNATVPGDTQTTQPGGGVVKNEYTRGVTNSANFSDTITFGINLGDVIAAAANISPWATADLTLGYNNNGSRSGYGWKYESRNNTVGTSASASYAEDSALAAFNLGFGLSGGVTLKVNDVFSFSPELGYGISFPIYGNKYTDIGGGEATAKGTAVTYAGSVYSSGGLYAAPNLADSGPIVTQTNAWIADVTERSSVNQNLGIGLKLAADFSRLSFAIKYTPGFTFENSKTVSKYSSRRVDRQAFGSDKFASYTQTTTVVNDDDTSQRSRVVWTNTINIGAQVWLKEDKFRLNLGSSFVNKVGDWTTEKSESNNRSVTTVTKEFDDGHEDASTITATTITGGTSPGSASQQTWTQDAEVYRPNYTLGFTFFLNENINFDFLLRSQEDKGENWLELLLPAAWAMQFNIRY